MRKGIGFLLALLLLGSLGYVGYVAYTASRLDMSIKKTGEPSTIYASDEKTILGKITATGANTEPLKDEQVPRLLRLAHVAAEDHRFYKHAAFDYQGLLGAQISNIRSGSFTSGGSSITQQTVKNVYLVNQDQNWERKLRDEPPYAYRLEQEKTKDQILTMYCNSNYYGRGGYGCQNGSMVWFGHPATELNNMGDAMQVAKAAFLASLLPQPSVYDDYQGGQPKNLIHWEEIRKRTIATLDKLPVIEFPEEWAADAKATVSTEVVDKAKQLLSKLPITNTFGLSGTSSDTDPYLLSAVKDWLIGWQAQLAKMEGVTEEQAGIKGEAAAEALLARGGLEIHTSIEPRIQKVLAGSVQLKPGTKAGALVLDPRTGSIDALYGGTGYSQDPTNYALYADRQVGSVMKAVVLTDAVRNDISPLSVFRAPAFVITGKDTVWNHTRAKANPACSLTLVDALASSNNPVAIELITGQMATNCETGELGPRESGYLISPETVAGLAHEMGADDSIIPGKKSVAVLEPVPALALGTSNLNPVKAGAIGATLANNGTHTKPWLVSKIVINQKTLFQHEAEAKEVISEKQAAIVNQTLTSVYTKGTGSGAKVPGGLVLAEKTGTTEEGKDAWIVSWSAAPKGGKEPAFVFAGWSGDGNVSSANMAEIRMRFFQEAMRGKKVAFPPANLGSGKRIGLK